MCVISYSYYYCLFHVLFCLILLYCIGLNKDYTLPERLITIQKIFYLNRINLVDIIIKQPYLLTSSVNRNIEIANFFSDVIGMYIVFIVYKCIYSSVCAYECVCLCTSVYAYISMSVVSMHIQ